MQIASDCRACAAQQRQESGDAQDAGEEPSVFDPIGGSHTIQLVHFILSRSLAFAMTLLVSYESDHQRMRQQLQITKKAFGRTRAHLTLPSHSRAFFLTALHQLQKE